MGARPTNPLPQGGNHRTVAGEASEAMFVYQAISRGWEITKPFGHAQSYDFVCRFAPDGPWEAVQVKTAFFVRGHLLIKAKRSHGQRYGAKQIDRIAAVHGNDCWLIPFSAVNGRVNVPLRSELWSKFKLPTQEAR